MLKVHILDKCKHCQGQAYLPTGEGEDYKGRKYTRFAHTRYTRTAATGSDKSVGRTTHNILVREEYNTLMIDIQKQAVYWRDSAVEDWQVANELIRAGRLRHGLFFTQLALEKMLKAHSCLHTHDLAPRIHNLVRLAEIAELELTPQQFDILAETNAFNIEGRYPDTTLPLPSPEEALEYLNRAEEIYQWLMSRLL